MAGPFGSRGELSKEPRLADTGLSGHESEFVSAMVEFGQGYGSVVLDDYRLFIDAFRNHMLPGL